MSRGAHNMSMADLTEDGDLEGKLWRSAEELRGATESAQYKYIVLEILFLKSFSEDGSKAELMIPEGASWTSIVDRCRLARSGNSGESVSYIIGDVVEQIEENNPGFSNIFPRGHDRDTIPDSKLFKIIELFDGMDIKTADAKDPFGRIYEYFLKEFAREEGRRSGEFYTPKCVVDLLVEILEPYDGKIFDPFCGSGGMFVQSANFLQEHGRAVDISIYGQELKEETWRICRGNLVRAGLPIENIHQGDSIHEDKHEELNADRVITNPPFNMEEWGRSEIDEDDPRFEFGLPTETGNFAFLQHMLYHTDETGMVGTVMANRTMFAQGGAGEIRRRIIEADLLDIVIRLPDNLFFSTPIPACIWVLSKGKDSDEYRDRNEETLLIDAEDLFMPVNNSLSEMDESHIDQIVSRIRSYRAEPESEPYRNQDGFCRRVWIEDFSEENYVVTPGAFVGKNRSYGHGFTDEEVTELTDKIIDILAESEKMNEQIRRTLKEWRNK